jgi:transposase
MNRDHFWLTAEPFSKIEPHLPTDTRGKARVDDRRVISGIINVLKSGGRWIDAPPDYGPRETLYNRYVRWAAKGVWVGLFHALAQAGGPSEQALITGGQVADCKAGAELLARLPPCQILHADKGYDSNAIRTQVEQRGAIPTSRPRPTARGSVRRASAALC